MHDLMVCTLSRLEELRAKHVWTHLECPPVAGASSQKSRPITGDSAKLGMINAWRRSIPPARNLHMQDRIVEDAILREYMRACILGPAFGTTDFLRIFLFEPPDFFRGFSRRFFSPHFCGKSAQKNSLGKSPGKSSQNLYIKNPPTHFCRLAGAMYLHSREYWRILFEDFF